MKNRLLLVVFSVVCLVALLMPGCTQETTAPAPTPPPAEEKPVVEVLTASICAFSGPGAAIHGITAAAWKDYFKYIQEKDGPICGKNGCVKVNYTGCDSEYKADKAKQCFSKLVPEGLIAHTHYASAHSDHLMIDYEAAKVPLVTGSMGVASAFSEWAYGTIYSGVVNLSRSFATWRKDVWEKEGKTGTLKIGFLGVDEPYVPLGFFKIADWCEKNSTDEIKMEAYVEIFPPAATDCTAQALRLKDAGVESIYILSTAAHGPMEAKSVRRAGIDPTVTPVAFATCCLLEDCCVLGGNEVMENFLGEYWTIPLGHGPDIPEPEGLTVAKACWERWHKGEGVMPSGYYQGVTTATVMEAALKLALDEVSPEEITGETLKIHGLDRIRDFDKKGTCRPFSYDEPGKNLGPDQVSYWRVNDGKLSNYSGWIEATTERVSMKELTGK